MQVRTIDESRSLKTVPKERLEVPKMELRLNLLLNLLSASNRVMDDWGKCMGDNAIASAILDRLMHHGNLLKFEGRSYRLKEAAMNLNNK